MNFLFFKNNLLDGNVKISNTIHSIDWPIVIWDFGKGAQLHEQ